MDLPEYCTEIEFYGHNRWENYLYQNYTSDVSFYKQKVNRHAF
jgi:hypothetical protein